MLMLMLFAIAPPADAFALRAAMPAVYVDHAMMAPSSASLLRHMR